MQANKTLSILLDALSLKNLPRTGWILAKAPCESVAEHTCGVAIIALALARMEKLPAKEEAALLRLALLHDLHEARIGDLTPKQKKKTMPDVAKVELEMMAGTLFEPEIALLQNKKGKLSILLTDADRLDMLFRAIENKKKGSKDMQQFIDSALKQIKSKSGKKLAKFALG
ncbi:MAG: HD domain-containing protein [Candidatus Anstonellaceae archaeon]